MKDIDQNLEPHVFYEPEHIKRRKQTIDEKIGLAEENLKLKNKRKKIKL